MVAKAFFFALIGVASAQEPRPNLLTHEELKALLSKTIVVQFTRGSARGTGVYAQDGTARLDGGTWSARGTWRVDGHKCCSEYAGIRRGSASGCGVQKTVSSSYRFRD